MKEERYFSIEPISNSGGAINLDIYNVDENLTPQFAVKYASGTRSVTERMNKQP